jgi:predicted RNA-binding protein
MCQISVVVEKSGEQENVMENVTSLQVTEKGVVLTTFFEDPLSVEDVVISSIDFLGGKVVLSPESGSAK